MYIEKGMKKNGYSPSIMQDDKYCYVTKQTGCELAVHEIYHGANRQTSKEHGFWCYLKPEYHNMSPRGVHTGNTELDLQLKQECQIVYEKTHTREDFVRLIGKSYIK